MAEQQKTGHFFRLFVKLPTVSLSWGFNLIIYVFIILAICKKNVSPLFPFQMWRRPYHRQIRALFPPLVAALILITRCLVTEDKEWDDDYETKHFPKNRHFFDLLTIAQRLLDYGKARATKDVSFLVTDPKLNLNVRQDRYYYDGAMADVVAREWESPSFVRELSETEFTDPEVARMCTGENPTHALITPASNRLITQLNQAQRLLNKANAIFIKWMAEVPERGITRKGTPYPTTMTEALARYDVTAHNNVAAVANIGSASWIALEMQRRATIMATALTETLREKSNTGIPMFDMDSRPLIQQAETLEALRTACAQRMETLNGYPLDPVPSTNLTNALTPSSAGLYSAEAMKQTTHALRDEAAQWKALAHKNFLVKAWKRSRTKTSEPLPTAEDVNNIGFLGLVHALGRHALNGTFSRFAGELWRASGNGNWISGTSPEKVAQTTPQTIARALSNSEGQDFVTNLVAWLQMLQATDSHAKGLQALAKQGQVMQGAVRDVAASSDDLQGVLSGVLARLEGTALQETARGLVKQIQAHLGLVEVAPLALPALQDLHAA